MPIMQVAIGERGAEESMGECKVILQWEINCGGKLISLTIFCIIHRKKKQFMMKGTSILHAGKLEHVERQQKSSKLTDFRQ